MRLERVRAVLDRLLRDGSAVARADGSVHTLFPVAVGRDEGEALRAWVVREGAARTIDIGLGYGISTLFAVGALLEAGGAHPRHVAVDPYQAARFANCGLQVLDDAGVRDLVEFVGVESHIALPRLLEGGRTFDLAFVDGNHRFDGVFVDLVYLRRLVRPGGTVFLDDYQLPAVARAASFFAANLGWTVEEVQTADDLHGWAVLRTSERSDARSFDHFVEF
jgi:predicted O-methyltransferase YrrM